MTSAGTLYGVGIGPGDPELVTLKALRLLQSADLIAYPAPEDGQSLARAIVERHIPPGRPEYAIRIPMDVARHPARAVYDRAAAKIASHLDRGETVVVLCEGDPFLYGSFMYLHARLSSGYRVEAIPGVTSVVAAAARIGSPLVEREEALSILPATMPDADFLRRLELADTAAILKVGRQLGRVRALLGVAGLLDDATLICHATMTQERIEPLRDAQVAPYFSIVIVRRRKERLA